MADDISISPVTGKCKSNALRKITPGRLPYES
jgi:hypothetical protein